MLKIKGFTLIEALIAILIAAVLSAIVAGVITIFASKTSDRILMSCLIEGASSGINACKSGNFTNFQIECGGIKVDVEITQGVCNPPEGNCSDVRVTAKAKGWNFSLTDKVCNFY